MPLLLILSLSVATSCNRLTTAADNTEETVDRSTTSTQEIASDSVTFDGYLKGIHVIEMTITGPSITVRKKDLAANKWGEGVEGEAKDAAENPAFSFDNRLARFPANFEKFSKADWSVATEIGFGEINAKFVRHAELKEKVGDQEVTAFHWAQKDSRGSTRDLIVGADNMIIAAFDPTNDMVLVRPGYEEFTTLKQWRDPKISQPLYGYKRLGPIMMPTRSGQKLATLVYLPAGEDAEGPFPTILFRTPYGIMNTPWGEDTGEINYYKQYPVRGYAFVLQAAQGTIHWDEEARSEGEHFSMVNEPMDGADTLEWITKQSWSNGEICSEGSSYRGYTQWTASIAQNPAVKCIIPEVSMGTAFSDQPYMGGTFVQGFTYYTFWMLNKKLLDNRTWAEVLRHRPIIDIDRFATGEDIPHWNRVIENATNNAYWQGQNWYTGDHVRNFGSFQISGWFDDDFPGTRSNWALMKKYGSKPNRLMLGPWRHGYNYDRQLNGYSYGIDAIRPDVHLMKQQWYDHFLKGVDNGITDSKVDYFVLGENQWRTAETWPPKDAKTQAFYFHSNGDAHRLTDDGVLKFESPVDDQKFEQYIYDPQDAVKNWYSFDLMKSWSDYQSYPYDFKDVETRSDVAIYTTPPLEDEVTIAGNIKVVLYASTDVKDTDWWAYISDVAPDYSSTRLSVGALRARFRNLDDPDTHIFGSNFETEELLSGSLDDVVRYEISIPAVANTFKKGHRIRVAIMNAHENYSFPNTNTGGHEGHATTTVPGTMRIHHSPERDSHILLPIMPVKK